MTNPVHELIHAAIADIDRRIHIREVNMSAYEEQAQLEQWVIAELKAERAAYAASLPAEVENDR